MAAAAPSFADIFTNLPNVSRKSEGSSETHIVAATSIPANIRISSSNSDVTISPNNINIINFAQTAVTYSVAHDSDLTDETATITYEDTTGRNATITRIINITDDDVAGTIQLTPSGPLSIDEGDSGTLSVSLDTSSTPTGNMTVSLSKNNNDLTLSPTSLTFTPSNHSTVQTVTVSAGQDDDATDDGASITLSASGAIAAPNVTKAVNITDDDEPGFLLTETSLSLTEGGSGTFGVRLSHRPSANVTVTMSASSSSTSLTIDTDPDTAGNQNTLAFARFGQTNAWNRYKTVTVTAGHDDNGRDDTPSITLTGAGGNYEGETATVTTVVDDDDEVGFLLTETSLSLTEGGSGTFGVRLATRPSANVTVTVTPSAGLWVDTNSTAAGNQSTLTFARFGQTNAWNRHQTVNVFTYGDFDTTDDSENITLAGAGGDYEDVTGSVAVSVEDTGSPEPAHSCSLTEFLSHNSAHTVKNNCNFRIEIFFVSTDLSSMCVPASSYSIPPNTRGFIGTLSELPIKYCVQHIFGSEQRESGFKDCPNLNDCGSNTSEPTLVIPAALNSKPAGTIQITPAGTLSIDEGDSTGASLSVSLSAAPNADVTVTLSKTNADVTLSPTSLTFTSSNHSTAQTVTVSAGHDDDADDDSDTITLSASGGLTAPNVTKAVAIEDDEVATAGFDITPSSLSLQEGDNTTLQVRLATQPSDNVQVLVEAFDAGGFQPTILNVSDGSNSTNSTGNRLILSFNRLGQTKAWNQYQTLTVSTSHDNDIDDESLRIDLTGAGGDYGSKKSSVSVAITDDDKVSGTIQVTPAGTLTIEEEGSGTLSVSLSAAPKVQAVINVTATGDVVVQGNSSVLHFDASNHSTAQTVHIAGTNDDVYTGDRTGTVTIAVRSGYTAPSVTKQVTVTDNEPSIPSGTIQLSPAGTLSIDEGDSTGASLSVRLSTAPNADVTVSLSKTNADVTLSPTSLTFTSSNHSSAQTVTVSAGHDDDVDDDSDTITLSASGGIDAPNATKAVSVADDDTPVSGTIEVAPSGTLSVDEGDSGTLSVSLSAAPNGDATVSLSKTNADVTLSPTSLTFTSSNHSSAQTVTVSAGHDDDTDDDADTITLSASGGITAPKVMKSLAIEDDDEPDTPKGSIDITPAGTLSIDEGNSGTLSVRLSAAPNADVTVSLSKTNADVSLSPASLTFTASNWSSAQTVTVSAAQDDDADDDADTITLSATGGINAQATTTAVSVSDDDVAGNIVLDPAGTLTVDEGSSMTFTVRLSQQPTGDVTLSLSKTGEVFSLDKTSLTFTASNWNTPRSITVTAAQDDNAASESDTITLKATGGIVAPDAEYTVRVADDDAPEGTMIIAPPQGLSVKEGASGTIRVSLSAAPNADVTVALSKPDDAAIAFDRSSLTFTTSDWNDGQAVVVSAAQDEDTENDSATITLTATGGINAPEVKVVVRVEDDDPVGGLSLSPAGTLEVVEGGSAVLGVSLSGEPTASGDVEVLLSNTDPDLTLAPAMLTFTEENWNRERSIILSALDDEDVVDGSDTITLVITGGGNYAQVPDMSVPVRILDSPGEFAIAPTTLNLTEGGEAVELEARLETRPVGTSTVVVTFTADRSGLEIDPSVLIFPFDGWHNPQRVSIRAVDDPNTADERVSITAVAVGGNYRSVERMATASIKDDDDESAPLPPIKSMALAFPPASAQDSAVMRVRCRQDSPCDVVLDCHAQADGSTFEASLPEPVPAWGTLTLTAADIEGHTGASWAGKGRLGCALRSEGNLSAQVWTRSGDGVLVNNSAFIRSVADGEGHRADIESIPEPESAEKSNFRIRCEALEGDDCTATRFSCYDDAGVRYDGDLGTVERLQVRHLQTAELVDIIDHRWEGMGLVCELRSSAPFTVQVLTRTGGGGALVNNSATGAR